EREALMEQRATELVTRARTQAEPWITDLPAPADAAQAHALTVVAAYRDRWQITTRTPLGPIPDDDTQRLDYERARAQLDTLTTTDTEEEPPGARRASERDSRGLA